MHDGWREVAVEEVAQVVGGGTPRSNVPEYWGGEVQWLTPKDLSMNPARYTARGARTITDAGLRASAAKLLPHGAVLLTSRAPVGYVSVASGPIATNQGFKSLVLDNTQLPEFWCYLLGHSTQYLRANSGGSTFEELSGGALKKLRFNVPLLAEQRRIVDVVGALDDTITALHASTAQTRALARLARSVVFAQTVQAAPTVPAGDIFDMLLGRQKSARQSVGHHVIPYLRAANISSEGFHLEDVQTMNFSPTEQERYCLQPEDVMLVEGGSLGQSSMWCGEIAHPVGFDKHVIRLRAIAGKSIPEYALQWTKWAYESGAFDAQATGVTIRALGFGRARAMPVPALTVQEQARLVAALESGDRAVETHVSAATAAETLRSNMLAVLLSGEHEIPESYEALIDGEA